MGRLKRKREERKGTRNLEIGSGKYRAGAGWDIVEEPAFEYGGGSTDFSLPCGERGISSLIAYRKSPHRPRSGQYFKGVAEKRSCPVAQRLVAAEGSFPSPTLTCNGDLTVVQRVAAGGSKDRHNLSSGPQCGIRTPVAVHLLPPEKVGNIWRACAPPEGPLIRPRT